ncbi:hypothetical protein FIV31_07870 [Coxiella endosymbiont of Ornithodoros amblus]|uniref:hypothetical protein n=1 Tax=Coxiella endosymbiont of Ornithodoros amblus TaxID=1656166 RepID=UPI00244E4469|nr:hypothetical protein [Coxiella endosymbiont of Ornithodoros amblus]MBW5803119.1 hypothetical protein [Coxiella endosymbiont of Ornithodoros amblus]
MSLSDKLFWEDEEGDRKSLFDYPAAQCMVAIDETDKKILFVAMEFYYRMVAAWPHRLFEPLITALC